MKDRIKTIGLWVVIILSTGIGWGIGQGILYYAHETNSRVTIDDIIYFWLALPFLSGIFGAMFFIARSKKK